MSKGIGLRIKELREINKLTQIEFSERIGIKQANLSHIENKGEKISVDVINKIISNFNIDIKWLFTGKGDMIEDIEHYYTDASQLLENDLSIINDSIRPHIDSIYAVCGTPNGFSVAIMQNECGNISIPYITNYDFSIRASGDSMINRDNPKRSIRDRDIVACRFWTSRTHLRWGEVYALATTEGTIIKKVMQSEKEGHIKCVSFNEQDGFEAYDLPYDEIVDWAIVVGTASILSW